VTLPVLRQGEVARADRPVGCGKTTLLRSLNRLTELTATASMTGSITLDGEDIHTQEVTSLRRRVSMVFQQPNPFPMSVFDNVAYALREQGNRHPRREELRPQVEEALQRAGLWEEVADRPVAPGAQVVRAASSSGSASRAPSPCGPRCSPDEPARRSTRARPRRSRS
jgi:phosphate transport system ATP-binding protein